MSKYIITIEDDMEAANLNVTVEEGRLFPDLHKLLEEERDSEMTDAEILMVRAYSAMVGQAEIVDKPTYNH